MYCHPSEWFITFIDVSIYMCDSCDYVCILLLFRLSLVLSIPTYTPVLVHGLAFCLYVRPVLTYVCMYVCIHLHVNCYIYTYMYLQRERLMHT